MIVYLTAAGEFYADAQQSVDPSSFDPKTGGYRTLNVWRERHGAEWKLSVAHIISWRECEEIAP